jgi:hypothetical protein
MTSQEEVQALLAGIWARHLGVKQVAGDGNFFALGGHSLLGVKMIGAVQDHVHSLAAPSEEFGEI